MVTEVVKVFISIAATNDYLHCRLTVIVVIVYSDEFFFRLYWEVTHCEEGKTKNSNKDDNSIFSLRL